MAPDETEALAHRAARPKAPFVRAVLFTVAGLASIACSDKGRLGGAPSDAAASATGDESPPPFDGAAGDGGSPSMSPSTDGGDGEAASSTLFSSDGPSDGPVDGASSEHDAGVSTDGSAGGRSFSTDRTQFFGSSRCAEAGVQLCEGFENGVLDKAIWTVEGTTPVIDGLQHARGNGALHITQPGNGLSYIKETKTFPEVGDTYWGRIFVFFKSLPAAPLTYAHWTFIAASGTGVSGEIRVSGQLQNGANLFGVGTDNRVDDAGTGDWTNSDRDPPGAPMAVPLNQWLCIEWLHEGDTNQTRFFWDGVEHPSLATSATMHGGNMNPFILPKFTNLWVGWQEYQTTTETFELWVDEIAIDSSRIGCVL
jgi:polysaccharide lyase-like protein